MIDDYSGGNSELFKLVIVIRTNHLSVNTAVEIVNCLIIVMGAGGGGGGGSLLGEHSDRNSELFKLIIVIGKIIGRRMNTPVEMSDC